MSATWVFRPGWRTAPRRFVALAAIAAACSAGAPPALAQNACFSATDLRHKPGEERVLRGTPRALVAPPHASARTSLQSPYAWKGVLRRVDLPPGHKLLALTFDLCEQPHEVSGYQGAVVDILRERGVRATFFAGGKWLLSHPTRAQQLASDTRFEVANHAWEHRNLRLLSGAPLHDEIAHAQAAYRSVRADLAKRQCPLPSAAEDMTLFRFPFGACNAKSLEAVHAAGLRAIQWDVSSSDPWQGQTVEKMVSDVVRQVRPGSIVLFHANGRGWNTDRALPAIIDALRRQGYTFATVSELLSVPGAKPVLTDTCYDSHPGDTDKYDALARTLADQHAQAVAQIRRGAGTVPESAPVGATDFAPRPEKAPRPRPPRESAPRDVFQTP